MVFKFSDENQYKLQKLLLIIIYVYANNNNLRSTYTVQVIPQGILTLSPKFWL